MLDSLQTEALQNVFTVSKHIPELFKKINLALKSFDFEKINKFYFFIKIIFKKAT